MAFRGVDYFCVDSLFGEEEMMVRQTARRFADERIAPLLRDCYRDARFPSELIPEMAELGFLGANLEGYGCAGMSSVEYGLIMQELERADSGVRSFVSVQGALVMYPILAYGSDEQKRKWLPRLQSGQEVGCFGLKEPGFGSNPAGIRDVQPLVRRLPGARSRPVAGRQGSQGGAFVPFAGALRHWLGRDRRGHGLLRNRARILHRAQAVRRTAHCLPPTGTGKTGLDDHRNHQGAVAGPARRTAQGPGQARTRSDLHAQAQQRRHRSGMRAAEPRSAGRQRDYGRIPYHASPLQPGNRQDLRGDGSHTRFGDWGEGYGSGGVQIRKPSAVSHQPSAFSPPPAAEGLAES